MFFVAVLCTAYAQISEGVGSVIIKQTGGRNASFTGNIEVGGVASVASLIVNGIAITGENQSENGGGSVDANEVRPDTDMTGCVGTDSYRYASGYISTFTVDCLKSGTAFDTMSGRLSEGILVDDNITFKDRSGTMAQSASIGVQDSPWASGTRIWFSPSSIYMGQQWNSMFETNMNLHQIRLNADNFTFATKNSGALYNAFILGTESKYGNVSNKPSILFESTDCDYDASGYPKVKQIGLNINNNLVLDEVVMDSSYVRSVSERDDGSRLQVHGSMSADGVRLVPGSGPATTTVPLGYVYLDSTDSKMKVYTSSGWKTLNFED